MNHRRRFITLMPFAGVALLAACSKESATTDPTPAPAPAPAVAAPAPQGQDPVAAGGAELPLVQESDPVAVGLGYVAVGSLADASKYPNYAAGQACSNCSLYGGQAGDAQGPCPLFAGKHVLATAWCSAYVKKAG